MAEDGLPTEFDAIILGTGMTECILAAALSRVGYKVLHLDRNQYYSGDWATFHFKALREWLNKHEKEVLKGAAGLDPNTLLEDGETCIPLQINGTNIISPKEHVFVKEKHDVLPETGPIDETVGGDADVVTAENNESDTTTSEGNNAPPTQDQDTTCELDANNQHSSNQKPSSDNNEKGPPVPVKLEWTLECMGKQWRKFNIDLMPKLLYCRGSMVELLISSDIAKYCEFRTLTRILTRLDDKLQQVPCSRSDVFNSKQVNVVEKRMLMKLLSFALDYDKHPEEYQGFVDRPFLEFLKAKTSSATVLHYVHNAIAMASDSTPTVEGLRNTQRFLKSLGRYGNTSFLWPMYGAGDLPQCFCRVCAVFGGTYCLAMAAHSVIIDSERKVQGIINTEGQRLKTKWLVMESSYASEQLKTDAPSRKLSRAILLVDDTILSDGEQHITLLSLPPPADGSSPVTVLELSSLSMACPEGIYVIHLTCETVKDPETDLGPAIQQLYNWKNDDSSDDSKPKVMWSLFFTINDTSQDLPKRDLPQNLFILSGPDGDLDFEHPITQAKTLFESLCPDEEFLPKAPNPEDIIYDDGDNLAPTGGGFDSEEVNDETNNTECDGKDTEESKPSEAEHQLGGDKIRQEGAILEDKWTYSSRRYASKFSRHEISIIELLDPQLLAVYTE